MYWISNNGIELNITKKQAASCSHLGSCDKDVLILMEVPFIRRQLDRVQARSIASFLNEYGTWSDEELASHEGNKFRLLWIACCDIDEEGNNENYGRQQISR